MLNNFNFQNISGIKLCVFLVVIVFSIISNANAQVLTGTIFDEDKQPIPYATIYISETKEGTTSNINGNFHLQLPEGTYHLTIRSMGYLQENTTVNFETDSLYLPIVLKVQKFEIKEVKVFPGKEDPAYFIMRKAMAKAPYIRRKIKHYSADLYIKSNFEFNNIPNLIKKQEVEDGKKFKDYFKENVTYVIESRNKITFNYPDQYKQEVISKKSSLTEFDEPPVMGLMTASFYDERPNQVVSPLSSLALKHYNFRYEGFITVGDFDVFKIKVTPKRKSDELVEGYIYIVDKIWCIYNLDFSSSFEFFDYRIKQQFENLGNENWMPVSHNINGKFGMLGLRGNFYYGASVRYDSIVDNSIVPLKRDSLTDNEVTTKKRLPGIKEKELHKQVNALNSKEELSNADVKKVARLNRKILKEQYKDSTIVVPDFSTYQITDNKDSLQENVEWDTLRSIPLTQAEIESYQRADSLVLVEKGEQDTSKTDKSKKKFLGQLLGGSYDLCKDSLIRISYDGLLSPVNFDYNAVDGYKFQQEFRMRFQLDSTKRIYATPVLGYAFNRKALFGSLHMQWVDFIKKGNRFSLKLGKKSTDFKPESEGISPVLNSISSWFFAENYIKFYEREYVHLNVSQQFKKHIYTYANVGYDHFSPLKNSVSFPLNDNKEYSPNIPGDLDSEDPSLAEQNNFSYSLGIGFRKSQRKPWLEESPFLFVDDYYSFGLNWQQGIPDIFNSETDYSRIEISFHQQANLSPSAGIDWKINAGHYFSSEQMHFSQYKHFKTAETPVLMKPFTHRMQTINDYALSTNKSYLTIGTEFRTEYILLRYFSFLNKRTWSESLHFNYVTTPANNNYWETGYSLNSLFFAGNLGLFAGFNGSNFESLQVKFSIATF